MPNQFGLSIDPADFGIDQPMGPAPNQGILEAQQSSADIQNQFANALNGLRGLQAFGMANAKASIPNTPIDWSVTHDENGEPSITAKNLRPDQIDYFQQASKFYQEALGGFAQQANQLQMQLQQAQQQPWQQLATALSANLAMQKDMPGWVQGLGRTAAQLNPSVDELRARYLATTGKGAEIAEKGMALGIAQQQMGDKDRKEAAQLENQLEDNYTKVQAKIEAEVAANKRVSPEQEQALRVIGRQTYRKPERIEADLARLRANATASASALKEQRQFETDKAKELAREADERLTKSIGAQDRRQAQANLVTTLVPLYKDATWKPADIEILSGMNKLDQTFEDFLKIHKVAGGPVAGRAAKLMAFFGDENAQKLLRDEAQSLISVLNSSGLSFARTSDKEMQAIYATLTRATNNPKVALDTAVRFQKWSDDVRKRFLQERYAGQYEVVAPYMPSKPLVNQEPRPDWESIQKGHKEKIAKPGTLEEKIVNLPQMINEISGKSGIGGKTTPNQATTTPSVAKRPTQINDKTGEVIEWNGEAWVTVVPPRKQ